ncbi:EAL domain-containing protein [bacterium]|nr:EAL domain-containing protein [bacterium]
MEKNIRILILEDNEADAELIERELRKAKIEFLAKRAETRTVFLREISYFKPDIVLSDYVMAGFSAKDALDLLKQFAPSVPLIVVSGSIDDQKAVDIVHTGAANYVTKGHLFRIVPAVIDALAKKRLREERERAADKLLQSEQQYRLLFEANPQPMWVFDVETLAFLNVNSAALTQYGYTKEEYFSMTIKDIRPPEDVPLLIDYITNRPSQPRSNLSWRHRKKDGTIIDVEVASNPILYEGKAARLVAIRDITERKRSEAALKESERRFRETLEKIQLIAVTLDLQGRVTFCNSFLLQLTGCKSDAIMGKDWFEVFFPPENSDKARNDYLQSLSQGALNLHRENEIITRNGAHRTILWNNTLLRDIDGAAIGVTSIGQDVTEQKWAEEALKKSERRYRDLFERNLAGVYRTTMDGVILDCNDAYAKTLGYSSVEEVKTHKALDFYHHPRRRESFLNKLNEHHVLTNVQSLLKKKDGSPLWVLENVTIVPDEKGSELIEGTMMDITEWKLAEERLDYLANYDQITDLPTRLLYTDRLKQAMIDASNHAKIVAVMLVDLDRFKTINDTLGHDAGDLLLRQVAQRLATTVQAGDTVGRTAGDEFTIILRDLENVQQAADMAQKILTTFEKPFRLEHQNFYIGASIGITLYPLDDHNIDSLFKNAETAMYKAKQEGRNNYQFYTAEMQVTLLKQLSLENHLRNALERKEFLIDYQPKVNLRNGMIVGAEALLKWNHPQLGLVSPAQFIPLAEETGSITSLGEWVLRNACEQCRSWQLPNHSPIRVAVNLSAHQFKQQKLTERIASILQETGLMPQLLEIEITETVLMQSTPETMRRIGDLKSLGIHISIDDFGTGFSSLSYLKQLPIDSLKIDQSFVRDIPADSNDSAITRAIIVLAHTLQLNVIAEGVETQEQLQFLLSENCDEMQGFYFSRPVPAVEFESLLRSNTRLMVK